MPQAFRDSLLANWEAGDDAPSVPQLRKMASAYKRPLAVFFLQEAPTDFQVMRDLRRLPGTGLRRLPPALVIEIRRAVQRRELVLELMSDLGQTPRVFELQAHIEDDPESVGDVLRTKLEVTHDVQTKWQDSDGRTSFNSWRSRIEQLGVFVFQSSNFTSTDASGFALTNDFAPIIVIAKKDPLTRRTFSLLHEFAHLMIRVSGVSDVTNEDLRPPEDQKIEIFCNHVAAAALMPKSSLLNDPLVEGRPLRSNNWTDGEISSLAKRFGVSREALLRRLLNFNRTTEDFYRSKRNSYNAEFLRQREELRESAPSDGIPRNMPRETLNSLGRPLVRMILGNYYQDRLTLSDVAGFLGVKTKHIAKIEQIAGLR